MLCYKDSGGGEEKWTDNLPEDTLVVGIEEGDGDDEATVGYHEEGGSESQGPGRHFMKIMRKTLLDNEVYRIAHEVRYCLQFGGFLH
jgi:hypothetical protein